MLSLYIYKYNIYCRQNVASYLTAVINAMTPRPRARDRSNESSALHSCWPRCSSHHLYCRHRLHNLMNSVRRYIERLTGLISNGVLHCLLLYLLICRLLYGLWTVVCTLHHGRIKAMGCPGLFKRGGPCMKFSRFAQYFTLFRRSFNAVSYTHLDVYKRQNK